jgi:hypothetical protein
MSLRNRHSFRLKVFVAMQLIPLASSSLGKRRGKVWFEASKVPFSFLREGI